MKGPVYMVKPKYIFKHPFNKYDLSNPTNRETQNQELTDYFNYGFNQDTMNIYGKLVKRVIEVLDHRKNLEYFNQPSLLMRLNDQIPMDFGGFCKFHDPSLVDTETGENFHKGDLLMEYFIIMIYSNTTRKIQFPLIQFVKRMYKSETEDDMLRDNNLYQILEQIGKNIEKKYQETLAKLYQKQNQPKGNANLHKKTFNNDRDNKSHAQPQQEKSIKKEEEKTTKKDGEKKKRSERNSSSSSSSSSDSSSSGSSSDSQSDSNDKKKRRSKEKSRGKSGKKENKDKQKDKDKEKDKEKERARRKSKERKKKSDKEKKSQKSKKVKKDKDNKGKRSRQRRSRSRDNKKKHR